MVHVTLHSCGEVLATFDADGSWQLEQVKSMLPERLRTADVRVRVFFGTMELKRSMRLLDFGVRDDLELTVVKAEARVITASDDGTAKIWSMSGECLLTLCVPDEARVADISSATFSPDGERVLTCCDNTAVSGQHLLATK